MAAAWTSPKKARHEGHLTDHDLMCISPGLVEAGEVWSGVGSMIRSGQV